MMRRARVLGALLAGAASITACSLAPDYHVPETPAQDAYKESDTHGVWRSAEPADARARGAWWQVFGDPQLDDLQQRAAQANQDLRAALARFEQARAEAAYARAGFFPSIDLNASSTKQRMSRNRPQNTSSSNLGVYTDNLLTADLSYELDFWGRVRNGAISANALARASAADLQAAQLSLQAELATNYFLLRSYDAEQKLLEDTVVAYEKALELTTHRFRGGAAAEVDVTQAQTQLETARAQALETRLKRAQLEHAIAVLVGEGTQNFTLAPRPLDVAAPVIPAGLPSTLLQRRPDIAAAERRVAAANADIGVARAAYFPVFSLGASFGYEGGNGGSWLTAPSRLWSLGPAATLPLFDGGARGSLSDRAWARYDEVVAGYRQSVLNAFREVEDNLAAQRLLEQEGHHQAAAVKAAERTLFHANQRYTGGAVNYLEVVTAQNAALEAQRSLVDVTVRRLNASVLLIKALGGEWDKALQ